MIETIENLDHLHLDNLYAQSNFIGRNGISDLMGLLKIPTLQILDLRDNKIKDNTVIDTVFSKMQNLRVLYFSQNPAIKTIK